MLSIFAHLAHLAQFYFSLIFSAINTYNCFWFDLTNKKNFSDWRQKHGEKWPMLTTFFLTLTAAITGNSKNHYSMTLKIVQKMCWLIEFWLHVHCDLNSFKQGRVHGYRSNMWGGQWWRRSLRHLSRGTELKTLKRWKSIMGTDRLIDRQSGVELHSTRLKTYMSCFRTCKL